MVHRGQAAEESASQPITSTATQVETCPIEFDPDALITLISNVTSASEQSFDDSHMLSSIPLADVPVVFSPGTAATSVQSPISPLTQTAEPPPSVESQFVSMDVPPMLQPHGEETCAGTALQPRKTYASELVVIEPVAGSAMLSRSIKRRGLQALPIDHARNRHSQKVRCLCLDLTKPTAFDVLKRVCETHSVIHIHMAPPCGTAARSRDKAVPLHLRKRGAPNPKQLRSQEFPEGLNYDKMSLIDKLKVDQANAIYELCGRILILAAKLGITATCENPRRSYMWFLPVMQVLLNDPDSSYEPVDFQNCMFDARN